MMTMADLWWDDASYAEYQGDPYEHRRNSEGPSPGDETVTDTTRDRRETMTMTKMTVTVSHRSIDPFMGIQPSRVETAECDTEGRMLADVLTRLMRRYDLPSGGTMTVTANGRTMTCDRNDFMPNIARRLLVPASPATISNDGVTPNCGWDLVTYIESFRMPANTYAALFHEDIFEDEPGTPRYAIAWGRGYDALEESRPWDEANTAEHGVEYFDSLIDAENRITVIREAHEATD